VLYVILKTGLVRFSARSGAKPNRASGKLQTSGSLTIGGRPRAHVLVRVPTCPSSDAVVPHQTKRGLTGNTEKPTLGGEKHAGMMGIFGHRHLLFLEPDSTGRLVENWYPDISPSGQARRRLSMARIPVHTATQSETPRPAKFSAP